MNITQKYLKELFLYRKGNLYWKISKSNKKINDIAGYTDPNGYIYIGINGKKYFAHRLIFLYHFGYFPSEIDHIDGNRQNNRIENLREATRSQNNCNKRLQNNNKSGIKGISWDKKNKKWRVTIKKDNRFFHLGRFENLEDAKKVIDDFREKIHKEFTNKG